MIKLATLLLEFLGDVYAWMKPTRASTLAEVHDAVTQSKAGDTSKIEAAIEKDVFK